VIKLKIRQSIPYFLGALVLGFLIKTSMGTADFEAFLAAAKMVAAKKIPYHEWLFISKGNYDLYFYSPLWATLLIPFSYLPSFIPNLLWLLANVWFLYRVWRLLSAFVEPHRLTKPQESWLLVLCIVMSARFIMYNFEMMQLTIFLLWGALESLNLFHKNKYWAGGMLLALVINIKILPVVLVPYLIYRREWKGLLYTLLFSGIFLFLPVLYTGWAFNMDLLAGWWSVINPFNAEHLSEADLGMHSLTALIPALLTKTEGALPWSRNILNLDAGMVTMILNLVRGVLILFTLFFLKWPPFRRVRSGLHELRELSYLFLLIPLIFPHQQKYAFFLAFPAFFYLSFFVVTNFNPLTRTLKQGTFTAMILLTILSFILMTLSTDSLIGRNLNEITQHFKTITYGAILLIVILILCPPGRMEHKIEKNIVPVTKT
jgi:hypothetical protein